VDDIAHVVNYDMPQEPESFIHRIGRTGRAGAKGASWTFVLPLERADLRNIEGLLGTKVQFCELPALPRPIGLITDVDAFLASMRSGQPAAVAAEPKPTVTRSFSSGRRRSGRR
jgi:superfamily II DNA/RNA helicase